MSSRSNDHRMLWLSVGLVAGLCLSYFWPHEPAYANQSDRDSKFGLMTLPVSFTTGTEGVFVIDYLTGRLQGAVINPQIGKFTNFYARNVAVDFNVNPNATPHYCMAGGAGQLNGAGGATMSTGMIYVAELTSGKVMCYAFPFTQVNAQVGPIPLQPIDGWQFRQPVQP